MICPEGFLQCGFKYLMAFRTDVFHMYEIVSADQDPPRDRHQEPDNERPPDTFDDPEDDGKTLQRREREPGQEHHQMQFLQFFLAFHNDGYVTDRFEGEFCFAFQSVFSSRSFRSFSSLSMISSERAFSCCSISREITFSGCSSFRI